jgi:lysophospholipase L1-like esterase
MPGPRSRTIILTDLGTVSYSALMAAFDGTTAGGTVVVPAPTISLSSAVSHPEGNSGTTAFVWTVTLNRDGSTAALGFTWAVSGVTANAADFGGTFPSGSGTFAAGETSKTITVLAAGDTANEPAETFTLSVTLTGYNTVTSTGTISNDDSSGPTLNNLTISNSSATVGTAYEGTIIGKTAGSSLALTGAGSAGLTISGVTISGTPTTAGAVNVDETISGASHTTAGLISVENAVSVYVPTLTAAPLAIYGMRRMVSGYSGPLYQLRRSDNATLNVSPASGSDLPDYSAISTWANGSPLVMVQRHDQTGGGKHQIAVAGSEPSFFLDQALAGCVPANFYGSRMDSAVATSRRNMTVLQVYQSGESPGGQGLWSTTDSGGALCQSLYAALPSHLRINGPTSGDEGFDGIASVLLRSTPATIGVTLNTSEKRVHSRETSAAIATANPAGSGTTFIEGLLVQYNFQGKQRSWGTVIYPALSSTDATALVNALNTMFRVPTVFTSRAIGIGDSIIAGSQGLGASMAGPNLYFSSALTGVEWFNLGVGGSTLADAYSGRDQYTRFYTAEYGAGKCIFFVQKATNDLDTNNQKTGANLYSSAATPLVSYFKGYGAGARVLLATVLPRTDGFWNSTREAQRIDYNTRVRANTAGADAILDLADTSTTMGALTAPDNNTLYVDKLHPTGVGQGILANRYAAALSI